MNPTTYPSTIISNNTSASSTSMTNTSSASPVIDPVLIRPTQLPIPSQKAREIAFATFAEYSIVIQQLKKTAECRCDESVGMVTNYMALNEDIEDPSLMARFSRFLPNGFYNYLAYKVDEITTQVIANPVIGITRGSILEERYIRNAAIAQFVDNVSLEYTYRESIGDIPDSPKADIQMKNNRFKERLLNLWRAYDVHLDTTHTTINHDETLQLWPRELRQIVVTYVGDNDYFKYKLLVDQIFSSIPITQDQAVERVLLQLKATASAADKEADSKLNEADSKSKSDIHSSTAINSAISTPTQEELVSYRIEGIWQSNALRVISMVDGDVEDVNDWFGHCLHLNNPWFEHNLHSNASTANLHFTFNSNILNRIGTLTDDILDVSGRALEIVVCDLNGNKVFSSFGSKTEYKGNIYIL